MRESPDGNFSFDEISFEIRRRENKDSFRVMARLLEQGNQYLRELPESAKEERIQINTELSILALLCCVSTDPRVKLARMKSEILKRSIEQDKSGKASDGLDIVTFHAAVYSVLEKLGLE